MSHLFALLVTNVFIFQAISFIFIVIVVGQKHGNFLCQFCVIMKIVWDFFSLNCTDSKQDLYIGRKAKTSEQCVVVVVIIIFIISLHT